MSSVTRKPHPLKAERPVLSVGRFYAPNHRVGGETRDDDDDGVVFVAFLLLVPSQGFTMSCDDAVAAVCRRHHVCGAYVNHIITQLDTSSTVWCIPSSVHVRGVRVENLIFRPVLKMCGWRNFHRELWKNWVNAKGAGHIL